MESVEKESETIMDHKGSPGPRFLCSVADPEVLERPKRRTYPIDYKLRMLREADVATERGEIAYSTDVGR